MVMHSRRWSIRTDRPNLGNGSVWCGRGGWRRCSSGRRIRTDHQCRSALPAAMLALVSKMCALSCLHCLLDSSPIRLRQIRPDAAAVASQAQNGPLDPRAANGGPRPRRPRRPACHGLQRPRRRRFRAALLALLQPAAVSPQTPDGPPAPRAAKGAHHGGSYLLLRRRPLQRRLATLGLALPSPPRLQIGTPRRSWEQRPRHHLPPRPTRSRSHRPKAQRFPFSSLSPKSISRRFST